jgi:hypothetical protein
MALHRAPAIPARRFVAGWPVFARLPFVQSRAYLLLTEELRRYALGTTRGRSFLIAGHRGSGKTALVRQVVEAAQIESLTVSEAMIPADMLPQRPLLVQLYGPSLVSGAMPGQTKPVEKPTADETPAPGNDAQTQKSPGDDIAKGALVQITIAFYRAVADEFAQAAFRHAGAASSGAQPGLQELAAQLRLDLDMGADASRLREMWHRLGCLSSGILWPGTSPLAGGQGVVEIAALVTAGQAFQVCAGKVNVTQSDKESATRAASIEAKSESGLKEFGDKLLSLTAGLGMGAGALASGRAGGLVAALVGVGVALLSSITLSWSGKRSLGRERATDYSFMPDHSVETLDRDLPMVIKRLRDVGLAPVFVVDELDKLAATAIDPAMAALIDRLKLLLTDHAFFCFLADRDYYDRLDRAVAKDPFCREHTYYNDRLFIEYRPDQLAAYAAGTMTTSDDTDRLAQMILSRRMLHQAELNFIRLIRGLSGLWDVGDVPRIRSDRICASPAYQVQVAVQLAVEHVLGGPTLGPRLEQDVGFAQLATDALYMISRAWLNDADGISLYREDVARHLLLCLRSTPPQAQAQEDVEASLLRDVSRAKLDALASGVAELAALLTAFSALHTAVETSGRLTGELAKLLPIFATLPGPGLLERVSGLKFRFRLDKYGISLDGQDLLRPGMEMAPELRAQIESLIAYVASLTAALAAAGTDPIGLIQAGLLPRTLSWGKISKAAARMAAALPASLAYDGLAGDLQTMSGFRDLFVEPGESGGLLRENLRLALWFCVALTELPRAMPGPPKALSMDITFAACARHLGANWPHTAFGDEFAPAPMRWAAGPLCDLGVPLVLGDAAFERAELDGFAGVMQSLRDDCAQRAPFDMRGMAERAWTRWEPRVLHYLRTGVTPPTEGAVLDDVLLAASGLLPSRLLRPDLSAIQPWEWSHLALEAAACWGAETNPDVRIPPWGLLAGLRALGFGAHVLKTLVGPSGSGNDLQDKRIGDAARFAEAAPSASQGILTIVENPELAHTAPRADIPILWVTNTDLERYDKALNWLAAHGVFKFEEVIRGRDKLSGKAGENPGL